jgi:general secretion pathway protein F
MPDFSFEAFDAANAVRRGSIQADSRGDAVGRLASQGLIVGSLIESRRKLPTLRTSSGPGRSAKARTRPLERLLEEWARLMQIGLNIDQALTISCTSHGASAAGVLAGKVRESLREGQSFAGALEKVFPGRSPAFITCIEVGERSGRLPEMLNSLAGRIKAARTFRSDLRAALAYPGFVLATTIGLIGILVYVVLPSLSDVLTNSDAKLPWTTQAIFDGAALIRLYGLDAALLLAAAVGSSAFLCRIPGVRNLLENGLLGLPMIGRIVLAIEVSSYVHTLSVQVRGGIGISKAVRACRSSLTLSTLRHRASDMEGKIAQGMRVSQAIGECFDRVKELPSLIRIGEENGRLADVLAHAGEHYEAAARQDLKIVTSLLTPAVTIATGAVVGVVVMSMMSALIGMNDLAFR